MTKEEQQFNKTLASSFFHHSSKGCQIVEKLFPTKRSGLRGSGFLKGAFCETHKADLCKCGWQFFKHYQYNLKKDEK